MAALRDLLRRGVLDPVRARTSARPHESSRRHLREIWYSPSPDGAADPGEVVWTWVPYEEDRRRGKDRPVLVMGRDGRRLLGLMLSSNAEREGRRGWMALGTGAWDHRRRASWVRLDRVLAVGDRKVRREGAALDRARFDLVAAELRKHYGWR